MNFQIYPFLLNTSLTFAIGPIHYALYHLPFEFIYNNHIIKKEKFDQIIQIISHDGG